MRVPTRISKLYAQIPATELLSGSPTQAPCRVLRAGDSDLQFLSREIKRKGYRLFPRVGKESDFDAAVKRLSDLVPSLTDAQMVVEIAKLMRMVGDGHSGILGGLRAEFLPNLPVQFYLFEEGLYIISADPRYKDLVGSQVIRFGGHTPDEVVRGLEPIINRDNEYWIRQTAPYRMRALPLLNALKLIPDDAKVELVLKGMDGKEQAITMPADATQPNIWNQKPNPPNWINLTQKNGGEPPLYLRQPGDNYWFENLPDKRTFYFQFNTITNKSDEPFSSFAGRMFNALVDSGADKMVVDLRWNNGGNTGLVRPLIEGLIANQKINSRGHLFVIIGRRTFSAAQNTATFLERWTNAIFIGEPTGSSPNFVGEESPVTLPYSHLLINVSDLYWESSFPSDKRPWIAPLIFLPPTFADYSKNRDPVMEAIFNYK